MSDIEADVIRLFISEAAFIAGSKRGQLGFDKTTKRALLHNNTNDTLAMGWSDDSLQMLLAGAQTATGKKTFQAGLVVTDNQKIELGDSTVSEVYSDGTDTYVKTTGVSDINIDGGASVLLKYDGTTVLTVESNGAVITFGQDFTLGNAWQSGAPVADGYVTLKDSSGNTIQLLGKKV